MGWSDYADERPGLTPPSYPAPHEQAGGGDMASYRVWGQVQRITSNQYLLLASACPVAGGRTASIVRTAMSEADARRELKNVIAELDTQLQNRGDEVVITSH